MVRKVEGHCASFCRINEQLIAMAAVPVFAIWVHARATEGWNGASAEARKPGGWQIAKDAARQSGIMKVPGNVQGDWWMAGCCFGKLLSAHNAIKELGCSDPCPSCCHGLHVFAGNWGRVLNLRGRPLQPDYQLWQAFMPATLLVAKQPVDDLVAHIDVMPAGIELGFLLDAMPQEDGVQVRSEEVS